MKKIKTYEKLNLDTEQDIFNYLLSTNKKTLTTYDFFVNLEKVEENINELEIYLNMMNSLIGKDDIEVRFKELVRKYPEVITCIPRLIAKRGNSILILDGDNEIEYIFNKNSYNDLEIDQMYYFLEETDIVPLLREKKIKNLVDYVFGVEVGLDSNARKNRSGAIMERIIKEYIKEVCNGRYEYMQQATAKKVKEKFGKNIPTDKASRRFDFIINDNQTDKLWILEVNYYGSVGSKLKATAGELQNLSNLFEGTQTGFIWITDGIGWNSAKMPLLEAFNHLDYIFNIELLEQGALKEIIYNP